MHIKHPKCRSRVITLTGVREGCEQFGMLEFANKLGIRLQAFYQWERDGAVPLRRVRQIEAITGVPAARIRPDHFGDAKTVRAALHRGLAA